MCLEIYSEFLYRVTGKSNLNKRGFNTLKMNYPPQKMSTLILTKTVSIGKWLLHVLKKEQVVHVHVS